MYATNTLRVFVRNEQQRRNQKDTLDRRSQAIDRHAIELNEREAEIRRREMELSRRERDLSQRERGLNADAIRATVESNIGTGGRMLLGEKSNATRRTPAAVQTLADQIVHAGRVRRGEVELQSPAPMSEAAQAILHAGAVRRGEVAEQTNNGNKPRALSLANQIIMAGKIRRGEVKA